MIAVLRPGLTQEEIQGVVHGIVSLELKGRVSMSFLMRDLKRVAAAVGRDL